MKLSRRASIIAIAAASTLALVSCSSSAAPPEDGVTEINFWSWDGAPGRDIVEDVIAVCESENPDLRVKYTELAQTDFKAKAAQSLGAGEEIDVLAVQPGSWAAEVEDYLLPVEEWPNGESLLNAFTPQSLEQGERLFTDGLLSAVPLYSTGSAVGVYNADILAEVGVEPPQTWSEFAALTAALKEQGDGIVPVTMPSEDWFQDEMALTFTGQIDGDFFNSVRYEDGTWTDKAYVDGLANYAALFEDGTFSSETLDMDYTTAITTFDEGKAAVTFNGSWEAGRILSGNYGVIPVPAKTADDVSLRAFLDVMLGIPAESDKQDAAATFIECMSTGSGVDPWATALKGIPAATGYELPEGTLSTDLQVQSYQTLVDLISNPASDRNNLGAFADYAGSNVKQVLFGTLTPAEAAEKNQAEYERGTF